ncbi:MAG: DUF2703 domain-containing protein [Candidatus Aenigmatarchaeota archaeon]
MLKIEFLYYDKITCERCVSTDRSVKQTLKELKATMKNVKQDIDFKETKLPESKLRLSPSILINGKDIEIILDKRKKPVSNHCKDCCKMVGHKVQCRTFTYNNRKYDHIPKEMIIEAIERTSEK